jgi:hypothetical protein
MIATGVLLGIAPIAQAHAFIAAAAIAGCWFLADTFLLPRPFQYERLKVWLIIGLITAILAAPLLKIVTAGGAGGHGPQWFPGWFAREWDMNWFLFWFKVWGPNLAAAAVGFFLLMCEKTTSLEKWHTAILFSPFLVFFITINLVKLHPWIWDNTKVLVWASIGFSGLAGVTVDRVLRHTKIGAAALLIIMTLFGVIDAVRIQETRTNAVLMYTKEELDLAAWARENTPVDSVWLTATNHNHWVFNLTGRQAVMTFPGWVWSHGYDFRQVEEDVHRMYQQPWNADVFAFYGVDYIVIGPQEMEQMKPDIKEFARRFPVVKVTPNYWIILRS